MKRGNWIQVYMLAFVLIGLTGAVVSDVWIVRMAFLIIAAVCGTAYFRWEKSREVEKSRLLLERQRKESQAHALQIVNHLRHDWMNDIQVLFGYIQLKKYDHLHTYVEEIKNNLQRESLLSKLGIPSLITFLLAFRVNTGVMKLEVELEQEINLQQLPVDATLITDLVTSTVELFMEHAQAESEEVGVLSLEFDVREEDLLLDFVYRGQYNRMALEQEYRRKWFRDSGRFITEAHDFQEEEAVIAIRLPYRS